MFGAKLVTSSLPTLTYNTDTSGRKEAESMASWSRNFAELSKEARRPAITLVYKANEA
jgi:hypothetical protein